MIYIQEDSQEKYEIFRILRFSYVNLNLEKLPELRPER